MSSRWACTSSTTEGTAEKLVLWFLGSSIFIGPHPAERRMSRLSLAAALLRLWTLAFASALACPHPATRRPRTPSCHRPRRSDDQAENRHSGPTIHRADCSAARSEPPHGRFAF